MVKIKNKGGWGGGEIHSYLENKICALRISCIFDNNVYFDTFLLGARGVKYLPIQLKLQKLAWYLG